MKSILLAVTGLSPQVVTETLFGIYQTKQPLPTEVHIITTLEGAQRAKDSLGDGADGKKLAQLANDYALKPIQLPNHNIHIIKNAAGAPIKDAATADDHAIIADTIVEIVRQLCSEENTSIHASIAGGRKTMGFLLGYAMSLFGRHQDKLSHVLISDGFESVNEFFYPTPDDRYYLDGQRKSHNARHARVTLIDIPFVRMGHELPLRIIEQQARYTDVVASIQNARDNSPHIELQISDTPLLLIAKKDIQLSLTNLAFYAFFLKKTVKQQESFIAPGEFAPDKKLAQALISIMRQLPENGHLERSINSFYNTTQTELLGVPASFVSDRIHQINTAINNALGTAAAKPYRITRAKKQPGQRIYTTDLTSAQVNMTLDAP